MKKKKKNKNPKMSKDQVNQELSATPILTEPFTSFDLVNKYGTYEIQPTADTDNVFPTIAQGLPGDERK